MLAAYEDYNRKRAEKIAGTLVGVFKELQEAMQEVEKEVTTAETEINQLQQPEHAQPATTPSAHSAITVSNNVQPLQQRRTSNSPCSVITAYVSHYFGKLFN